MDNLGYNWDVIVVGLSAFYHDSACCILRDGRLVAAAAEERFTRVKHDPRLPVRAYRYCLQAAGGLSPADIDCLAYYERPEIKRQRQAWSGVSPDEAHPTWLEAQDPEDTIRRRLGYDGPIVTFDHHLSHAASAFYFSGFDEAAVLTVDGVGEWATTTYGRGSGDDLEVFEEVLFPHSLGLLYATLTAYLGFRVNNDEYKVMGLAAYGRPRYVGQIRRLIQPGHGGQFVLDMAYFDFAGGQQMYTPALADLLGREPRQQGETLEPFHQDIARSLQQVLEEILLEKAGYLAKKVDTPNMCMAGGVALNCVANGRIRRESSYRRLFFQPAAGDAGGCLGAAALAYRQLAGRRPPGGPLTHVYFGPRYGRREIAPLLASAGIQAIDFGGRLDALLSDVAGRLAGNQVVGWFQGGMEFGPRALGARSILANPMDPSMKERLNRRVKRREGFRPFAPVVLLGQSSDHFDLDGPSPFMMETCQVRSPLPLPAITHIDGSARPQTVQATDNARFAALLVAFEERTGCPVLLNTSLNIRGEPIVCSPAEALICMVRADLDALVLEDFLIERAMLPDALGRLLPAWETRPGFAFRQRGSAVHESLYTLV